MKYIYLRQEFITWYHEVFQASSSYTRMIETVEGSPYHRERSVAAHTDMVVSQYLSRSPDWWTEHWLCGALACAFHDVGKPGAEEIRFKPERGEYRAYSGHEPLSARLWEQYASTNWKELCKWFGDLDAFCIYSTAWMIEHHLPYGVKKPFKLERFHRTAGVISNGSPVFETVLQSDGFGRISDDAETKRAAVMEYCKTFSKASERFGGLSRFDTLGDIIPPAEIVRTDETKTLFLPVGASGSGKSTWRETFVREYDSRFAAHSWDDLRLEWYCGDDYTQAFEMSTQDKGFAQKADAHYRGLVDDAEIKTIVVDNTNLTVKRRRQFIDTARRAGYVVVAVMFPITQDELRNRHFHRTDKAVPLSAVMQQWRSIQQPFFGEVDDVVVWRGNLSK